MAVAYLSNIEDKAIKEAVKTRKFGGNKDIDINSSIRNDPYYEVEVVEEEDEDIEIKKEKIILKKLPTSLNIEPGESREITILRKLLVAGLGDSKEAKIIRDLIEKLLLKDNKKARKGKEKEPSNTRTKAEYKTIEKTGKSPGELRFKPLLEYRKGEIVYLKL
ncbi:hypothetical protein BGZ57DRAFT_858765 [Hyaloscypha finlandica]|nr:hypothetical protein BGZ57DRAFT_858765 [Hyaloscypha finlandica]